jgi:hypothetical protein
MHSPNSPEVAFVFILLPFPFKEKRSMRVLWNSRLKCSGYLPKFGGSRSRIPGSSRRFADKWNHGFYRGLTPLQVACGHCAIGLCYPCEGAGADRPQRKPTAQLENDASPATVFTASPAAVGRLHKFPPFRRTNNKRCCHASSTHNSLIVVRSAVKTYQSASKLPRVGSSYSSSAPCHNARRTYSSRVLDGRLPSERCSGIFQRMDTLQWPVSQDRHRIHRLLSMRQKAPNSPRRASGLVQQGGAPIEAFLRRTVRRGQKDTNTPEA